MARPRFGLACLAIGLAFLLIVCKSSTQEAAQPTPVEPESEPAAVAADVAGMTDDQLCAWMCANCFSECELFSGNAGHKPATPDLSTSFELSVHTNEVSPWGQIHLSAEHTSENDAVPPQERPRLLLRCRFLQPGIGLPVQDRPPTR